MKRFTNSEITRISNSINLSQMILGSAEMTKGRCPFCSLSELRISTKYKTWHCFSCGAGGDSIRFVMLRGGVPFKSAVEQCLNIAADQLLQLSKPNQPTDPFEGIAAALGELHPTAMLEWNKALGKLHDLLDRTRWIPGVTDNKVPKWTLAKADKLMRYVSEIPFVGK